MEVASGHSGYPGHDDWYALRSMNPKVLILNFHSYLGWPSSMPGSPPLHLSCLSPKAIEDRSCDVPLKSVGSAAFFNGSTKSLLPAWTRSPPSLQARFLRKAVGARRNKQALNTHLEFYLSFVYSVSLRYIALNGLALTL